MIISPPKKIVYLISVALGIGALALKLLDKGGLLFPDDTFWLAMGAWLVLAAGNTFKGV